MNQALRGYFRGQRFVCAAFLLLCTAFVVAETKVSPAGDTKGATGGERRKSSVPADTDLAKHVPGENVETEPDKDKKATTSLVARGAFPLLAYFRAGGFLMYPLLLCSLLAIAVIIERAVRLRRSRLIDPEIVDAMRSLIESGDFQGAIALGNKNYALVGHIFLSRDLEEYINTAADIETSITEAGDRNLQVLYNNLSVLTLISRIAPLLGLLGTVLGMIKGFASLEAGAGVAQIGKEGLAGAIKIALITTATGLIIAIPTIIATTYFRSRIRRLLAEFEEIFIDVIKSVKNAPETPPAENESEE